MFQKVEAIIGILIGFGAIIGNKKIAQQIKEFNHSALNLNLNIIFIRAEVIVAGIVAIMIATWYLIFRW